MQKDDGVVEYVDANKITIRYSFTETRRESRFDGHLKPYNLIKFRKTNQGTCINLKPIIVKAIGLPKDKSYVKGMLHKTEN